MVKLIGNELSSLVSISMEDLRQVRKYELPFYRNGVEVNMWVTVFFEFIVLRGSPI